MFAFTVTLLAKLLSSLLVPLSLGIASLVTDILVAIQFWTDGNTNLFIVMYVFHLNISSWYYITPTSSFKMFAVLCCWGLNLSLHTFSRLNTPEVLGGC
jgi:hypothetical protein